MKKNIIFLYAELTEYLLWCIEEFIENHKNFKFTVIQLEKKKTSSYNPKSKYFTIKNKSNFNGFLDLMNFIKSLNPVLLFVSGRMSIDYLIICLYFKNKIPITTCQDSLIENNFKFKVKKLLSKYFYHIFFDNFWGTGDNHVEYAKSMGFNDDKIFKGFYLANRKVYRFKRFIKNKKPKLLLVGRKHPNKNIDFLINVLEKINQQKILITLTIIGIKKESNHKFIDYLSFKNSNEINLISSTHDFFILPSKHEPWGVVTHEQLMIGNPVIISDSCGSSILIQNGVNGFIFKNNDKNSLEKILLKIIRDYPKGYDMLSKNAAKSSEVINFQNWENTIINLL